MSRTPTVAVAPAAAQDLPTAAELAAKLSLPLIADSSGLASATGVAVVLLVARNQLSLQQIERDSAGPVSVDFGAASMRHRRRGGHNELLGRAVGVSKKPGLSVLDATAGLARDSFVLADLGCQVILAEREPILAELLAWGLVNARDGEDAWLCSVVGRMTLLAADARKLSTERLRHLDVIYLDPMFPPRSKSAAVKKEMALFQLLLQQDESENDAADLLQWALQQPVARVVVKRPRKAAPLALIPPSHAISGRSVRFDVYVLAPLDQDPPGNDP